MVAKVQTPAGSTRTMPFRTPAAAYGRLYPLRRVSAFLPNAPFGLQCAEAPFARDKSVIRAKLFWVMEFSPVSPSP
jgi:hypothetical protein